MFYVRSVVVCEIVTSSRQGVVSRDGDGVLLPSSVGKEFEQVVIVGDCEESNLRWLDIFLLLFNLFNLGLAMLGIRAGHQQHVLFLERHSLASIGHILFRLVPLVLRPFLLVAQILLLVVVCYHRVPFLSARLPGPHRGLHHLLRRRLGGGVDVAGVGHRAGRHGRRGKRDEEKAFHRFVGSDGWIGKRDG